MRRSRAHQPSPRKRLHAPDAFEGRMRTRVEPPAIVEANERALRKLAGRVERPAKLADDRRRRVLVQHALRDRARARDGEVNSVAMLSTRIDAVGRADPEIGGDHRIEKRLPDARQGHAGPGLDAGLRTPACRGAA